MAQLLLISIGPVQDFIAASRRGRDLWFSSWLLSELGKAAARHIADKEGLDALIFPAVENSSELKADSYFNCVNKILALVESAPASLMEGVRQAVRETLLTIWDKQVLRRITDQKHLQQENALRQLEDFVELAWVSLPLPQEEHYAAVRDQLEALLMARKSLREFTQVTWGAPASKSALDGLRESVIHEDAYKKQPGESLREKEARERQLYQNFGVSPGERLCAIGLLKRLGRPGNWSEDDDEQHRTPSTYHIAAMPFMWALHLRPGARDALSRYINDLRQRGDTLGLNSRELSGDIGYPPGNTANPFPYQGQILYQSRLPNILHSREAGEDAAKELRRLLRKVANGREPSPYYALVLADGDNMGRAVDAQKSPAAHQKLSRALSKFAASVRGRVEGLAESDQDRPSGRLIYAGGDDILAFYALDQLLDGIETLAAAFKAAMKDFEHEGIAPTLSFGVIIAHQLDPLGSVLERLRDAERLAKNVSGKQAVALTLSKRGGPDVTVSGPTKFLIPRLKEFVRIHGDGAISDRTAFELRDAALRHREPSGGFTPHSTGLNAAPLDESLNQATLARKALAYDALRILGRKQAGNGTRAVTPELRSWLEALLLNPEDIPGHQQDRQSRLEEPLTDPELPRGLTPLSVRALADELIVARILADARDPLGLRSADRASETPLSPEQKETAA